MRLPDAGPVTGAVARGRVGVADGFLWASLVVVAPSLGWCRCPEWLSPHVGWVGQARGGFYAHAGPECGGLPYPCEWGGCCAWGYRWTSVSRPGWWE